MKLEIVFTLDTSSIKFGPRATREVGHDMKRLGSKREMVATDRKLVGSEPVSITLDALRSEGIDAEVSDQVHIELTDASFKEAIKFASEDRFDGYVAVGEERALLVRGLGSVGCRHNFATPSHKDLSTAS